MPMSQATRAAAWTAVAILALSQAGRALAEAAAGDILAAFDPAARYGPLSIIYPFDESLFPPEIAAPTFRWDDAGSRSDRWLVVVDFEDGGERLTALADARQWKPAEPLWQQVKRRSVEKTARATVLGVQGSDPRRILSAGSIRFSTSRDAVGAPIFYRDVPLPFNDAVKDPTRIKWRWGLISSQEPPPVILEKLPVCGNCHSFSADGSILGMDIDYANDKGSYALAPVSGEIVLDKGRIITWSDYLREDKEPTFGLLSQVSPDGRYAVSTVKDRSVFVAMPDLAFSQLFFPLQGILVVYDRQARTFAALPGADDRTLVQSNPSWSPDGRTLYFARAKARKLPNLRNKESALLTADECKEFTEGGEIFQYDLYRIPFAGGKGGTPEPVPGASANGKSNYFPKCSPDGRWLVFCQARSFMLLQPDSRLYIMPAAGGEPRLMRCNTGRMNSWHSWSPNGRWLVFSSKAFSPYTQLFLTHVDAEGRDTPPVLLENFTSADRAANIPEFVNLAPERLVRIREQFVDDVSFWRAGNEYLKARDFAGAAALFRKALEINPRCAAAYAGLGLALAAERKTDEAIAPLMKAIEIQPSLPGPHFGLAGLLAAKGRMPEALAEALAAVRLQPDNADAQSLAGALLLATGKAAEAVEHLATAVRLGTADATAYYNLAQALCFTGKYEEAIPHYEEVLRRRPDHASALNNLAMALARTGRTGDAIGRLTEAVRLKPDPGKHFSLATLLGANGQPQEAVAHCRKALQLQPDHAPAMAFLAWILATADDAGLRSGAEAVQLATKACELTQSRDPRSLGALAAAWAETGRFPQAVQAAAKAAELARAQGNATLSREIEQQMALYQQGKPFRSSFGKAAASPLAPPEKTAPPGDSRR